jgi:HD-like signal output (HDOD) protein
MTVGVDSSPSEDTSLGFADLLPEHLRKSLVRLNDLNSLPEITTRILDVVEDPRATAQDLHNIVKIDPALATRILRVVNSAFYGLPSQVASLDRGIVMLGLSAVKNIALATSLSPLFAGDQVSRFFNGTDLWRHSIAVGVCARLLARRAGLDMADEAFVAGLVHDVGLLVIGQLFPAESRLAIERCYAEGVALCSVEQQLIGADHQTFGAALAERWSFPPLLCFSVGFHHQPDVTDQYCELTSLVYVADTVCCRMMHAFYVSGQHQELPPALLAKIGLTEGQIAELDDTLRAQIDEAERVLAHS